MVRRMMTTDETRALAEAIHLKCQRICDLGGGEGYGPTLRELVETAVVDAVLVAEGVFDFDEYVDGMNGLRDDEIRVRTPAERFLDWTLATPPTPWSAGWTGFALGALIAHHDVGIAFGIGLWLGVSTWWEHRRGTR